MNAIEATGIVDAEHQLRLDEPLPIAGPSRVRVIILIPEAGEEIDERAWTRAAASSPAFDFLKEAVRPAVCLTDPIGLHRHVVMAFISSQTALSAAATDVALDPGRSDFRPTGLRVASVLRVHRLVTLNTSLIRRELGELSPALREEVDKKLAVLFGLKIA